MLPHWTFKYLVKLNIIQSLEFSHLLIPYRIRFSFFFGGGGHCHGHVIEVSAESHTFNNINEWEHWILRIRAFSGLIENFEVQVLSSKRTGHLVIPVMYNEVLYPRSGSEKPWFRFGEEGQRAWEVRVLNLFPPDCTLVFSSYTGELATFSCIRYKALF